VKNGDEHDFEVGAGMLYRVNKMFLVGGDARIKTDFDIGTDIKAGPLAMVTIDHYAVTLQGGVVSHFGTAGAFGLLGVGAAF
jgi:hypothetical protein